MSFIRIHTSKHTPNGRVHNMGLLTRIIFLCVETYTVLRVFEGPTYRVVRTASTPFLPAVFTINR